MIYNSFLYYKNLYLSIFCEYECMQSLRFESYRPPAIYSLPEDAKICDIGRKCPQNPSHNWSRSAAVSTHMSRKLCAAMPRPLEWTM